MMVGFVEALADSMQSTSEPSADAPLVMEVIEISTAPQDEELM